jgi:hypothetical protein
VKFKPFSRLCGVCGLSIAVVLGEEKEHLHIESHLSPAFWRVDTVAVQSTSSQPVVNFVRLE